MKWNWGTGIALSMGIFMTFLVVMVVKASRADTELQYEDYYEQELDYQSRIDALQLANPFKDDLEIRLLKDVMTVRMSEDLTFPLNGYISFFRPNDQSKDLRYVWSSGSSTQSLPVADLIPGVYEMEVHWTADGKGFLLTKEILIPESW